LFDGGRVKKRLKAIDLFAGCGGLTEGLRNAGFDVVLAIDSDRLAADTYRRNHRRTRVIRTDITKVSPSAIMKRLRLKPGDLDLLAGCPRGQYALLARAPDARLSTSRGNYGEIHTLALSAGGGSLTVSEEWCLE
jgi:site-specific DNA-cytosine methylase